MTSRSILQSFAFLVTYIGSTLMGGAAYVVCWQLLFDKGRVPSDFGWIGGSLVASLAAALNLCGLNQILVLIISSTERMRRDVGFGFAASAGFIFVVLPLAIRESLRQSTQYQSDMINSTFGEYVSSWVIFGCLFVLYFLLWATIRRNCHESNKALDRKA